MQIFGFDKLSVVVRVKYKFQDLNKLIVFEMEWYFDFLPEHLSQWSTNELS